MYIIHGTGTCLRPNFYFKYNFMYAIIEYVYRYALEVFMSVISKKYVLNCLTNIASILLNVPKFD